MYIRDGRVIFVEFKRKGKKPTEKQVEFHDAMRAAGATVVWFDNRNAFVAYFEQWEW